jgi:sugar phosphate isomerase/epimerase
MKLSFPVETPGSDAPLMACRGDFESNLSMIHEIGYDAVELLVRDPRTTDPEQILHLLKKYSLKVSGIATSPMEKRDGLRLIDEDQEKREECLSRCMKLTETAAYLQAPIIIGKLRGNIQKNEACTWSAMNAAIAKICEKAQKDHVHILIEPQNRSNINNLNTIDEALTWLAQMKFDNLGLLVDIYHMETTENSICVSLIKAKDKIGLVHMADSDRRVPGFGHLPIKELMAVLNRIEYSGYLSLEIKQKPDSFRAARMSYDALNYIDHIE